MKNGKNKNSKFDNYLIGALCAPDRMYLWFYSLSAYLKIIEPTCHNVWLNIQWLNFFLLKTRIFAKYSGSYLFEYMLDFCQIKNKRSSSYQVIKLTLWILLKTLHMKVIIKNNLFFCFWSKILTEKLMILYRGVLRTPTNIVIIIH